MFKKIIRLFLPKVQKYVSETDLFLASTRKFFSQSFSQSREINKHQALYQLRDRGSPKEQGEAKKNWQDFLNG